MDPLFQKRFACRGDRGVHGSMNDSEKEDAMNQRTWIAARHGIALVVLMGWAACGTAENVWTSQGPADLGATIDLAIVDSTVFAGTWNGVFRSEDGGVHWRQSGLGGVMVRRVDAAPGGAVIFATTPEGAAVRLARRRRELGASPRAPGARARRRHRPVFAVHGVRRNERRRDSQVDRLRGELDRILQRGP